MIVAALSDRRIYHVERVLISILTFVTLSAAQRSRTTKGLTYVRDAFRPAAAGLGMT